MASYAFVQPILPGKVDTWKRYIAEMTGPKKSELQASRKKAGLTKEQVWLQHSPAGDQAIVYWEAPDIGKVFHHFMTSSDPFDKWFLQKILMEVHGMNPSSPPPPMNEAILNFKG